jgi:uncharacterized protein DUF5681
MPGRGRIENLRPPWKPGESGNPSGRPKKRPLSSTYVEFAERRVPDKFRRSLGLPENATFADAITQALFLSAINGNVPAARELREATEGKADVRPKDPAGDTEIRFKVIYEQTPRIKRVDPDNSGGEGSGNGTV